MLASLAAVARKEFLHVRRDPATRFVFLIPVLQLILFGYAIRVEVTDIPLAVVDLDRTLESRELVDLYANTRTFELVEWLSDPAQIESGLVAGRFKVGLQVPDGFGDRVRTGELAEALVLVDGSYSTEASTALNVSREIAFVAARRFRTAEWDRKDLPRVPTRSGLANVELRTRLLFNPDLRDARFFVPGLVGVILQLVTMLLTSFSIVRERESGTFEQMLVTPVGPWSLLLGKLAPYAAIGMIETGLVLVLMVVVFDVPIVGSLPLLLALAVLFLVTSLSLGLLISTFARNQSEAMQLTFLILLPSILLSGFVFPLDTIPAVLQPVTYVIPVRYFIEVLRGIILRGAGFDSLWPQAASLALFTSVLLSVSALRFRRRVA